jgi:23S rRNA (guanosine2251-2'-O)-methyltransferase
MAPGKRAGGSGGKAIAKGGQGGRAGKPGSHRKGAPKGTGGYGKDKLEGRKATPPAEQRTGHPAARRAASAAKKTAGAGSATGRPAVGGRAAPRKASPGRRTPVGLPGARRDTGPRKAPPATVRAERGRGARSGGTTEEVVAGRNPVVEALRAGVPASALLVAPGLDHDERVVEVLAIATKRAITVREVAKGELDRLTDGASHQGLGLVVSPYQYAHPDDLLTRALQRTEPALLVACDGVTDPRNLGAIVRSAAAFGAHGVVVPERRSAGMTAGAWKASAGAAARVKVAAATNLPRVLKAYADAGVTVVGLASEGSVPLDDLEVAIDPLCLVVGSEGAGLGRLVSEHCDLLVHIPMPGGTESLNASVAAAIALHEIARRRRQVNHPGA